MAYDSKSVKVELSKEKAKTLAQGLCNQIDSSITGRESVKDRWDMIENIFRCDQKTSNLQIADSFESYVFPMYRQKATKIGRTVLGAYFNLKPWVQMIDVTRPVQQQDPNAPPPQPIPDVERTYQSWLESSNLKNVFSTVFMNMVHFNCGIAQVCTKPDGSLFARNIHPSKSIFYPCQTPDYNSLITMGHQFLPLRGDIEEGLESGLYNKDWLDLDKCGVATNRATRTTNDEVMAHDNPIMTNGDDEPIECYELVTKLKLKGDTKREWYLALVEKQGEQLMSLEHYPYSRPWYFVYKTSYDEDNMYPSDSIGGVMQGLQLAYNDGNTLMLQGSLAGAFPLIVVSGGSLSNKTVSYQAGQMIESSDEIKLQYVSTGFNPGALAPMMQKIEQLADGVSGMSRLGTTEALPGHTTATAASGFLQAQQESKDEYVEGVASPFKDMAEFIFEMMVKHTPKIALRMGKKWQINPNAEIDPTAIDIQPTGGGTTTDPQLLGQKLMTLQQMASNPASSLDPEKVETKMVEAMDFPFDTDSLKKPPPNPNTPPPPLGAPTMSISVKFEELGAPNLSPMQLDALDQFGFNVPPPEEENNGTVPGSDIMGANGSGQPNMDALLQQLGMGGDMQVPGNEAQGSQIPPGNAPNGGQIG